MENTYSKHRVDPWLVFIAIVGLITFAGYFVLYPQTLFKPGERMFDTGYNLGLAGGIMMLVLLLYPLRKRVRYFHNWGPLPIWFRWHMVLGILGPLTIIFHSTYHVYIPYFHPNGSPNAAVAMLSMLIVSASGTFGRFFYTKIHHGLYGHLATVNEIRAELDQSENVKYLFVFAPEVEMALEDFRARAENYAKQPKIRIANFVAIGFQARKLSWSLSREVRHILRTQAKTQHYSEAQRADMEKKVHDYRESIESYLKAMRNVAQFGTYERMFSWWHIFHIPLVYMMVFSALYHVYAVHAY
ncbi:conserved hypothetical protein [Sideroxydans lithotrophicus ES-1]|uniref:FAD-dependent pyridine nucleotide-disulfide oxidoreductase n=2 Tax=Sideroxydans TaxID=314343 RepID=D5CPG7_SIDLE|nr:conserved hypothetical protein [Sideroxydans lithotrophicus ES-1]